MTKDTCLDAWVGFNFDCATKPITYLTTLYKTSQGYAGQIWVEHGHNLWAKLDFAPYGFGLNLIMMRTPCRWARRAIDIT